MFWLFVRPISDLISLLFVKENQLFFFYVSFLLSFGKFPFLALVSYQNFAKIDISDSDKPYPVIRWGWVGVSLAVVKTNMVKSVTEAAGGRLDLIL